MCILYIGCSGLSVLFIRPRRLSLFFSIVVVVVKSSPSTQTHSQHFQPSPATPTHPPSMTVRAQFQCHFASASLHYYCRVTIDHHHHYAPKTFSKRIQSFVIRHYCHPQWSVACLYFP